MKIRIRSALASLRTAARDMPLDGKPSPTTRRGTRVGRSGGVSWEHAPRSEAPTGMSPTSRDPRRTGRTVPASIEEGVDG